MGDTYTRQSSTEIVDGEVINATDFNNEFAQLVSAFAASTGHSHDGTAAEGGPVTKLLGTAITIGDGSSGTDIAVTFDGETSDGVLTWMEDEDHFKFSDDVVIDSTKRLYLNDEGGEHISGDGTDVTIASGADINLTATADVNIPSGVGITFGNDGEKIEGDGTDLTISGNNINLTATADVNIPSDVGITFATTEKIESDGTDLSISVGSGGDINIPADIGVTFGNDGEKIEGDGTDLTISGNNINLTATADVNIPTDVGITFATAEKIESDGTDLTITVGAGGDINIPTDIGITFGDDGEKIEGDGTNLTISSSAVATIDAETDIVLDANGADVILKDDGTTFGSLTNSSGELVIKSGSTPTTALTFSGDDVTFADDVALASDSSALAFGTNSEVKIIHNADKGLILKHTATGDGTPVSLTLQTGETALTVDEPLGTINFQAPDEAGGTDAILVAAAIEAVAEGTFASDNNATKLSFKTGASEAAAEKMSISSVGNITMKNTATGDDTPVVLTLQTGETDIAANDVIGKIDFQAPDEGTGTDAILVAAGIAAVSEGDFAADNNATKLSFRTGASEAASEKMSLSSAGLLTVADDIMIKDGGTIGVASTNDALTLSSAGLLTVKDDLVIKSGGTIGGAGDTDLLTLGSAVLTVAGEISVTTLDIGGTDVGSTAAELNLLDGSAKSTSSITIADSDAFIIIDGTTTKQIPASDISTYVAGADPVAMAIALG